MSKRRQDQAPGLGYKLHIGGEEVMSGDALEVGEIFGKLDGRSFSHIAQWQGTHIEYLKYMTAELKSELTHGRKIAVVSPDGDDVYISSIGAGVNTSMQSLAA